MSERTRKGPVPPLRDTEGFLDRLHHLGMPLWVPRYTLWVIFVICALLAARWAAGEVTDLITWLFVALFVAIALDPGVSYLARRGWRRGAATALIMVGVVIAGIVFVALMIPLIVNEIGRLIEQLPIWIENLTNWLNEQGIGVDSTGIIDSIESLGADWQTIAAEVASGIIGFGATLIGQIFAGATIALFAFYLTADGPRWRRGLMGLLPQDKQAYALYLIELSIDKTGGYIYSRLLLAVLSGVSSTIVFTILGLDYAAALGAWVGLVSQFIPTIGTYIAGALPILVALTESWQLALVVLAWILIYQQIENYVFSPKITAHTMELHPAVSFGAAIAGVALMGPVGALLGIPVAATIQAFSSSFVERHELVQSELLRDPDFKPKGTGVFRWSRQDKGTPGEDDG